MALYDHILLPEQVKVASSYSPRSGGGGDRSIPDRNRAEHARALRMQFDAVWDANATMQQEMEAISLPSRHGTYVEFKGRPACELITGSLEDRRADIRLLNIRDVVTVEGETQTIATVFIPHGKESKLLNKLNDYADATKDRNGKPKNDSLIRSIEQVNIAMLDALWTASADHFPSERIDWYEVWIRTKIDNNDAIYGEFEDVLRQLYVEYKSGSILEFPERSVFLVRANRESLIKLIYASDYLAEIRSISPLASFFTEQRAYEQREWIDELIARTEFNDASNSVISILDTGVNNGHPLLTRIISNDNCDTVVGEGPADRGDSQCNGHGTQMCGVVAYGDLTKKLESVHNIQIDKHIASIKILGKQTNNKDAWGDLTSQAVSKTKIAFPQKQISYCLAVTEIEECENGKPSSWSGSIDTIASDNKSLFLISAGNIYDYNNRDKEIIEIYPDGNRLRGVFNPAQAWNGLTIGAYTDLIALECPELAGFDRIAPIGGISPFSRTSGVWVKESLIKPEVMFEGGNLKKNNHPHVPYDTHEALSILTLNNDYQRGGYFDTINATSCATAMAADFAGQLQARYSNLWAESIRGLMVHSARWTDSMINQFPVRNRRDMAQRLRNCGYGVPSEKRAFHSTENGFTFIAQETIQPYIKKRSSYNINEMHLYELPWPQEELRRLGEIPVTLRITLSYFIDPAPGEIGWKDKYRYASYGLRFDLNNTNETRREFELRINDLIKAGENEERVRNDSARWLIGSDNRDKGSVHSDEIVSLTATELAECNLIAIFPIGGWWKTDTVPKSVSGEG